MTNLASPENYRMYLGLIDEEYDELLDAVVAEDKVEQLDALVDILVVTIGAIRAAGWRCRICMEGSNEY